MKLIAENYVSPLPRQGEFSNVTIEDVAITHKRSEKKLTLTFEASYIKNGQKIVLATSNMLFFGMEDDIVSSNRTMIMSYPNLEYIDGGDMPQRLEAPFFTYLAEHEGELPVDYSIVDFGYPTYEKVLEYFTGGTFDEPEITISNPLAIGFVMSTLKINAEAVGAQFTIV